MKILSRSLLPVRSQSSLPVVKKVPEPEALDMAYRAVNEGAAGVDMGRNVLQAECPSAMLQAIRMVVHENVKPEAAYKAYQTLMKDVK